jgi:threonine/homoserine/homoserine lactone efflux protein
MTLQQLLPFLVVVAMITITPGPDTALVLRNTLRGGVRDGLMTAFGATVGLLVWGVASALGLSTVMVGSATLFAAIRIVGGVYLLWMGMRILWGARKSAAASESTANGSLGVRAPRPFMEGLLSDLLNPKAAAFFTALLPQFVTSSQNVLATTLLLAGIASTAAFVGLLAYTALAARARVALHRRSIRRRLDQITGVVLLALGIRMLARELRA